ncbi:primosomal protein N' [Synechocystis sp. PCC 7509]|uniref:primosomal protein N' n=1 Tax=Synechocystis sp. PCC 7509 TaxID=927677 RepID=UPI0002ACB368|nr:primosomal protein N' [Synechocystis sp. PCC 7509]
MYIPKLNESSFVVAEPISIYQPQSNNPKWIEVLVDCPGATGIYTYKLPESMLFVKLGSILSVPFGTQQVGAIAIRLLEQPSADVPIDKIREVEEVVSVGFFGATYWELLQQVAAYYYTSLMAVIKVALPPGLLGRSQRRIRLKSENIPVGGEAFLPLAAKQVLELLKSQSQGEYSAKYLKNQIKGSAWGIQQLLKRGWVESYLELPRYTKPQTKPAVTLVGSILSGELNKRQQEILQILRDRGGELWLKEFLLLCKTTLPTLKTLASKGYIVIEQREVLRQETSPLQAQDRPKTLTNAQSEALAKINSLDSVAEVLLHGVTGSGKTEVYLQAIAPILAKGKSALVLVPEIGLTPQLTDRFRARFGEKVCVYHSALSDGERYDTWRQMLTGEPQVVIGTRSAVFAPLPNLGLIILDEEHDNSFKQDSPVPTYHARNVAKWKAKLENCPLILGSATPSLESWVNRTKDNSYYLSLPERIQSRPLPPVEVVDMRKELQLGNRSIFSRSLQEALKDMKARSLQGILFIHRRGHSTFVSCRSCGYVIECPNCDVSLAYHQTETEGSKLLQCHYCNYVKPHPRNCPECSSPYLKFFGSGTQRVAQELIQQFPELRFIRFDSDTTRTKGAHRNLLTQFANKEADLLVGTQMLTKGLDLPQVTLVGVMAADGLLHLADYRASERAFQTLTQVAGRAGRGDDPGRVIVQTYTPDHAVIEAVQKHEFEPFIATELEQRAALNYPPYGRLILLRLSSIEAEIVEQTAQKIAEVLASTAYDILGPAPANVLRVANRYRWQIMLKFAEESLPQLPNWEEVRSHCPPSVSLTIDVDPLNMM